MVNAEIGSNDNSNTTGTSMNIVIPPWLTKKYVTIYKNYKTIKFDLKHLGKKLEYITGIITDLHVDWHKLKGLGHDSQLMIPNILNSINQGDFNGIVVGIMGSLRQYNPVPLPTSLSEGGRNGSNNSETYENMTSTPSLRK